MLTEVTKIREEGRASMEPGNSGGVEFLSDWCKKDTCGRGLVSKLGTAQLSTREMTA